MQNKPGARAACAYMSALLARQETCRGTTRPDERSRSRRGDRPCRPVCRAGLDAGDGGQLLGAHRRRARRRDALGGADKERLAPDDVLLLPLGEAPPKHASAEPRSTGAFITRTAPSCRLAHAHPPATTTLSLLPGALNGLHLEGLELLKVFPGIATHEAGITVPVLPNTQDMAGLAERLAWSAEVPALILQGHGIYCWGEDTAAAFRHMEALGYMFDLEWRRRALA
ncbi:MAG: class II aldolase/adducin family protein [Alphaproteobacteria bacterium]